MCPLYVVTGATGFLGQAIVAHLYQQGDKVVTVSRNNPAADIQVADYRHTPGGDILIHLAEDNDIARVNAMGQTYEQEKLATLTHLLAKKYQRVLYASSAVLYGDAETIARSETDPIHLRSTYTRVKHCSEQMVLAAGDHVAFRLTNLYGPGMSNNTVVKAILGQLRRPEALYVKDDQPVRDFLWVGDAAQAIVCMARGRTAGLFNLGTGSGTSIKELAHLAMHLAGDRERLCTAYAPSSIRSHLVVDITRIQCTWKWRPETTLNEGLFRLISAATPPTTVHQQNCQVS